MVRCALSLHSPLKWECFNSAGSDQANLARPISCQATLPEGTSSCAEAQPSLGMSVRCISLTLAGHVANATPSPDDNRSSFTLSEMSRYDLFVLNGLLRIELSILPVVYEVEVRSLDFHGFGCTQQDKQTYTLVVLKRKRERRKQRSQLREDFISIRRPALWSGC